MGALLFILTAAAIGGFVGFVFSLGVVGTFLISGLAWLGMVLICGALWGERTKW